MIEFKNSYNDMVLKYLANYETWLDKWYMFQKEQLQTIYNYWTIKI